ncbi:single-stranded DNA-binding protein [Candidatus Gottesmanbacteria bacterium]|nr:single-stranded DNA-binding protein [Candidatus Gottesmanbacteria bacterium]
MASRSLNKVMLIGNLTRDPELRYTPTGAAVCSVGLATNRYWTTESGEKKEETEFHRVVAWNKLAELCSQLLTKGRKVYVEGRLRTTSWQAADGSQRNTTEIVIEDMILLDPRRTAPTDEGGSSDTNVQAAPVAPVAAPSTKVVAQPVVGGKKKGSQADEENKPKEGTEEVNPDDIPF